MTETIDSQIERAQRNGDARLLSIAYLRQFVEAAEKAEGRTNRFYSSTLEMLVNSFLGHGS